MHRYIIILLALNILLAGCSSNAPITENRPGTIKKEKVIRVQKGTVTNVKKVTVLGEKTNVGRTMGSTAGSITGAVLGSGYGSLVGSIFGGMIGGAAGSSADRNSQKKPGLEITIQLDAGQKVTVTQLATPDFKTGDKVNLIMQDNQVQVAHL